MKSFVWNSLLLLAGLGACAAASNVAGLGSVRIDSPISRRAQLHYRRNGQKQKIREELILPKPVDEKNEVVMTLRGGQVANTLPNALMGAVVLALLEKCVKEVLKSAGIKFPPALGACIFLFVFLIFTDLVSPSTALSIFQALTPGATLLAKWLPVMFVPSLVMLPLSPSIGGKSDLIKVLLVIVLGFIYTLSTTILGVMAVQKPKPITPPPQQQGAPTKTKSKKSKSKEIAPLATKPIALKPFSDETWNLFLIVTIFSGALSLLTNGTSFQYATLVQTIFLTFLTGAAFIWSARLPAGFVKVIHPLVTSSTIILVLIRLLSYATGVEFFDILRSYKTGKLLPLHQTGAGDLLMYALGPTAVSFAIAVYSRKNLLVANLPAILSAMIVSSVGGLFGTALFVSAVNLGGKNGSLVRLSVLARNVTTALAVALSAMIGGDISITAAVVCLTGIVGASYGKSLLNYLKITDPLVRGLAIGASSQGVGIASLADEPDAFPFGAISMVLTAIAATTLMSIPSFQNIIIKIATR